MPTGTPSRYPPPYASQLFSTFTVVRDEVLDAFPVLNRLVEGLR